MGDVILRACQSDSLYSQDSENEPQLQITYPDDTEQHLNTYELILFALNSWEMQYNG